MSNSKLDCTSPDQLDAPNNVPAQSTTTDNTTSAETEGVVSVENPPEQSENACEVSNSSSAGSQSSSFHPKSETSTIEYDQTPFVDFSIQVKELCHSLWPPSAKEYRVQRLLGGPKLLGVLRTKKLGRFLSPASPPKAFEIERMSGGSFNRITGIRIIGFEGEDPISLVLRTPRAAWNSRPDREVATLEYIRQYTEVPVPRIIAFDVGNENPLKSPYLVQNRIPGVSLQTAINEGITHQQWCTMAREIGRLILELQKIGNPTPGLIENAAKDDEGPKFSICPFDIRSPRDQEWKKKQASSMTFLADNAKMLRLYEEGTYHFLATQFGRWRADTLHSCPIDILYRDQMRLLAEVASEMNALGMFSAGNCLTHMDLAARNIMVELGPQDSIRVTGVLDWDEALFGPKWVSCRPTWWLWQDEKYTEDAMVEEEHANDTPDDPELLEIKTIYEEIVGEEYVRFAYQPQYLIARRLFDIALHGNNTNESMREAEAIIDHWAEYTLGLADTMSESSFSSAKSTAGKDGDNSQEAADSHGQPTV